MKLIWIYAKTFGIKNELQEGGEGGRGGGIIE